MSDSFSLTSSQELELLGDPEVISMMTLIHEQSQQPEQQQHDVYHQQLFTGDRNGLDETDVQYSVMPNLISSPPAIPVTPHVITNEEYSGPLNFEVIIDPHYGSKNPWVYSTLLNKIFISMSNPFPIDFKWTGETKNLYVRATPLFSLAQHAQELVTRCIPHSMGTDISNRNVSQRVWDHIVRCQNPYAVYDGNKQGKMHFSVVVPLGLPQTGTDTVRIMYSFVCKNSCQTGMNRRPFEVIFTLENGLGIVLGRRRLSVRVCSCPKRDKDKEEKDYLKESGENCPPSGKKRKFEKKTPNSPDTPVDTKLYSLNLTVRGKHNAQKMLNYGYDIMAGDMAKNGPDEEIKKCMATFSNQLKNLD